MLAADTLTVHLTGHLVQTSPLSEFVALAGVIVAGFGLWLGQRMRFGGLQEQLRMRQIDFVATAAGEIESLHADMFRILVAAAGENRLLLVPAMRVSIDRFRSTVGQAEVLLPGAGAAALRRFHRECSNALADAATTNPDASWLNQLASLRSRCVDALAQFAGTKNLTRRVRRDLGETPKATTRSEE